jgi:hypothetical protein
MVLVGVALFALVTAPRRLWIALAATSHSLHQRGVGPDTRARMTRATRACERRATAFARWMLGR